MANLIDLILIVTWKRNKTGDLSTADTTASTIIFRHNHIFVANVGDSTAILAVKNPKRVEPNQHHVNTDLSLSPPLLTIRGRGWSL